MGRMSDLDLALKDLRSAAESESGQRRERGRKTGQHRRGEDCTCCPVQ